MAAPRLHVAVALRPSTNRRPSVTRRAATAVLLALLIAMPSPIAESLSPSAAGVVRPSQASPGLCNFSRSDWATGNKAPYGADCPFLKTVGPINCLAKPRNRPRDWLKYRLRPANCSSDAVTFKPTAFLERMRNKVFASVGDSLSYTTLMPSLLCQLHQVSPVEAVPNSGRLAARSDRSSVYRVKAFNVTLVNTWSTFLNQYWQDQETVQRYNGGRPLTDEDSVVNLEGVDAQWAPYVGRYDVLLLQTQAHWQATRWKWRRYFVDGAGTVVFNESAFIRAFEYGMGPIRALLNQTNAPLTYFISAPARIDTCTKASRPSNEVEVVPLRHNNRQYMAWLPAQRRAVENTRIRLLDVTSSSLYRSDAFVGSNGVNKDCVHYCLPGVPDWWVAMLDYTLSNESNTTAKPPRRKKRFPWWPFL